MARRRTRPLAQYETGPGSYDKLVRLMQRTETNTKGTVTFAETEIAKFWCSLWPLRGREYYESRLIQAAVTHLARTWWRSDITPGPAMYVECVDESRTFEIESVIDVDEAHEQFEFRLVEKV